MKLHRLASILTLASLCAGALAAPAAVKPPVMLAAPPPSAAAPRAAGAVPAAAATADTAPLPPPSSAAQQLYSSAKNDILQVRSLLNSGRTQSSVGSRLLIRGSNRVISNYHLVSQFAL